MGGVQPKCLFWFRKPATCLTASFIETVVS